MQVCDDCVERLGHDSGVRAGHECSALNGVTELAARLGYLDAGTESDCSKRRIPKELHEMIARPRATWTVLAFTEPSRDVDLVSRRARHDNVPSVQSRFRSRGSANARNLYATRFNVALSVH